MITTNQAQTHLKNHQTKEVTPALLTHLSTPYQILGELALYDPWQRKFSTAQKKFTEAFGPQPANFNPWQTSEGQALATILYGPKKAHLVPAVWEITRQLPYQTGYNRRPFRHSPEVNPLESRLTIMRQLHHVGHRGFHGLDVFDTARYSGYYPWQSSNLALWYTAALADPATAEQLFTLLVDITEGEDEIGLVNRGIIQGLLTSPDPRHWEPVEKLLLAAQREEGLRQTILESLDQTSPGALTHFISVVLDNDLARFSAVVRAVDVWFGFGWEAPKKATINRVLTLARDFLANPDTVEEALTDKDNLVSYVALWSLALTNVATANARAIQLITGPDSTKRLLGLMFLRETELSYPEVGAFAEAEFGQDLATDYWLLTTYPPDRELPDSLFNHLINYGETLSKDGTRVPATIFPWQNLMVTPNYFYEFAIRRCGKEQLRRLCTDLAQLPSTAREQLLRRVFPDNYSYSLEYSKKLDAQKAVASANEDWKRNLIRQAATDRNGSVMATGIRFLEALELSAADKELIVDLLRRKSRQIRSELIRIVLAQDEATLKEITSQLLAGRSIDQRLAGLEILTVLHEENRLMTYVLAQQSRYRERGKFNKNEEVLLDRFTAPLEDEISFANGFGVVDFSQVTPLIKPAIQFQKDNSAASDKAAALNIVKGISGGSTFLFPDLVDEQKMIHAFKALASLLEKHGKLEYEMWYSPQYSQTVLLENSLGLTDPKAFTLPASEQLAYLPLSDVWRSWYQDSGLNDFEILFGIHLLEHATAYRRLTGPFEPFLAQYLPAFKAPDFTGTPAERENVTGRMANLLRFFLAAFGERPTLFQFQVDLLEDMTARLPESLRQPVGITTDYGFEDTVFWALHLADEVPGKLAVPHYNKMPEYDAHQLFRLWQLQMLLWARTQVKSKLEASIAEVAVVPESYENETVTPDALLTLYLYQRRLINDHDLLLVSLHNPGLFKILNGNLTPLRWNNIESIELPDQLMAPLRKNLLELELQRGDLPTDATPFVTQLPIIKGTDYLVRTLERMGKEPFHRGYAWGAETSKKVSFSGIVKKALPSSTDTAPAFSALINKSQIPRKRLLEVAMYAPQWAPWVAAHLGIDDLEIAVWWFHAHASDYMDGQKEKVVSRFSPVAREDFAQGAIDVDWFYAAYNGVGKKTWRELHEAAKYISDGNGHRQVKTYSAVMLGEVKITETLKKIKEKRDKVYVKALGLIPFSAKNPEGDVLRRYKLLQAFVRESKQFGAQRQESEKNAARIGLDNLARNAGHDDTTRFGWIMEAEETRVIMEQSLVGIDNVTLQLIIDEQGQPDIRVAKDGKPQKTIPAKLRKHKAVVTLKQHKADLRRQYSRTRQSLEQAMLNGVRFSAEDLIRINRHPVVRPLLSQLVMLVDGRQVAGFWQNGQLLDAEGQLHPLTTDDTLRIAHPAHLYQMIEWDRYQRFAFDNALVQPFKQIFRELYLLTLDERELKTETQRYQGHQIQPRKAVALLRARGWTVSDTEGLQRVYHKYDVVANLYAAADWYSPADVEAPAIESVGFTTRKGATIPLTELDPVLFSEVMRDVDLVVSVAHVGGVDPEASHSTLQMRAALARESARLFKADNVEVKDRHIVIEGKHGSYNIHLGSGMVSKGGLQLNIIAVGGQHRGRLFLPFLDDDPKSAEIVAKLKLLAEDYRITDPSLLGQILG